MLIAYAQMALSSTDADISSGPTGLNVGWSCLHQDSYFLSYSGYKSSKGSGESVHLQNTNRMCR